jgi:C1A family cysteine protease
MKSIFLVALFLGAALAISTIPDDVSTREHFQAFMKRFNKAYSHDEFRIRYNNFRMNLAELSKRQKANPHAHYNVTKFFDMSREEFRRYPCGVDKLSDLNSRRPDFVPNLNTEPLPNITVPASWDWTTKGAVTPVKNQEQCGSCWAFSTIGNVEGVWFLGGHKLVGLSEQQEVSCSTTDYGCSGGWPFWALTDMLASPYHGRIDTEAGFPYTSGDGDNGVCHFSPSVVGATIKSYKSYCTEQTAPCLETQMQQLLVTYGPLSVCLDAGPMQYYQGGIDNPTDCDPNAIDHCVTMVGYGTENGVNFWKIKNSWGTDWGESGFYRLIRGTGACGINKVITIASLH